MPGETLLTVLTIFLFIAALTSYLWLPRLISIFASPKEEGAGQ
jgi:hypothetical protein